MIMQQTNEKLKCLSEKELQKIVELTKNSKKFYDHREKAHQLKSKDTFEKQSRLQEKYFKEEKE